MKLLRGMPADMAGILARFTTTPLLWAAGLELVAIAVLGGLLYLKQADVDVARAAAGTAQAHRDVALTERDAWKQAAGTALGANAKWETAFETMRGLLKAAQGENRRLDAAGRAAVRAAQERAALADRTLQVWKQRYEEQLLVEDCADALNAVQVACPAMEGY